jgi:hypothetical protein
MTPSTLTWKPANDASPAWIGWTVDDRLFANIKPAPAFPGDPDDTGVRYTVRVFSPLYFIGSPLFRETNWEFDRLTAARRTAGSTRSPFTSR